MIVWKPSLNDMTVNVTKLRASGVPKVTPSWFWTSTSLLNFTYRMGTVVWSWYGRKPPDPTRYNTLCVQPLTTTITSFSLQKACARYRLFESMSGCNNGVRDLNSDLLLCFANIESCFFFLNKLSQGLQHAILPRLLGQ